MKSYVFLFALLPALSCKQSTEKTIPKIETISESVYASGIVKSKNQFQVYSTVNGVIDEILVREGDLVTKDDLLIRIVNDPQKLSTDNARLAAVNNSMNSNSDKLTEAKVVIDLALSKMKNDSLMYMRQSNLWAQKIGSQNEFEQKQLAYRNAVGNYKVALLNYKELKQQLVFTSNQSRTMLKISAFQSGDYLIKAEMDGRIYKILKEKGEFVNTVLPVAIMGDANDFIMELKVDEYDISRILIGQKVLYSMDSYKGKVFEGAVYEIEPLMNEQSRSFTVKAIFVTKPEIFYPNLSVEANIIIRTKIQAMTIPRGYLIGDSMVELKNGKLRKVKVGLKDYQKAEILDGITISDMIYKSKP